MNDAAHVPPAGEHGQEHGPSHGHHAHPVQLDRYTFGQEQLCFGCGPHNPIGLQLRFERIGDQVITRFTPGRGQEGPPGIFHGGLQVTVVDELAGWTLVGLLNRMGFTASMQVRYIRPVRIEQEVLGRGRIVKQSEGLATVKTVLEQNGRMCLTARIVYALPDLEGAEKTLGQKLPEEWKRFCG